MASRMNAHARAGIDIHGSAMRYAEVEHYGARQRLLRLGSCDFEFDVTQELLRGEAEDHLEALAEALRDVFSGSAASELHVALHPPTCQPFFSAHPAGRPAGALRAQLQREAVLLGGDDAVAVGAASLDPGPAEADFYSVLSISRGVQSRLEKVLSRLPQLQPQLRLSTEGIARVLSHLPPAGEAACTLALGWYDHHVEVVVSREGRWVYSHQAPVAEPIDAAYYAALVVDRLRLQPADVGSVLLYGPHLDLSRFGLLERLFGVAPQLLNPVAAVDLEPGSLAASFDAETYAPCIGVAL